MIHLLIHLHNQAIGAIGYADGNLKAHRFGATVQFAHDAIDIRFGFGCIYVGRTQVGDSSEYGAALIDF